MDEFTTFTYEDFDSFCEDENERPAIDALPMVSAASFAGQKPPAMSDAVFGLIPSRIVVTLNGDGAVGKSLLALQLCIASVSGTPWLGLQVQQGPCLFITAEDEIGECHRRINAICTAGGRYFQAGGLSPSAIAVGDLPAAFPAGPGLSVSSASRRDFF